MIISASRRTDIPSYYGEWFMRRLREGSVFIPNPYNAKRYSKARLTRDAVDIIAFWTKNPTPFLQYLSEIDKMGYVYYFQFTLTPYGRETESGLPDKNKLLEIFINLSKNIGKERLVWRYDPIIISSLYDVNYHAEKFAYMVRKLSKYTERCIISFVDSYKNVSARMGKDPAYTMTKESMFTIASIFSKLAKENDLELFTCSEELELKQFGIQHGACIDKIHIEKILGSKIHARKDKNQRQNCLCVESIDIGTYNCCANGCNYCYALTTQQASMRNMAKHNPKSPVLIGEIPTDVIITERESFSIIERQLSLMTEFFP